MRIGTSGFDGDRLREAREARGLSPGNLADVLGITRQGVGRYESGAATPSPAIMGKLADALNLPPGFFLRPRPPARVATTFYRSMTSATKSARVRAERLSRWLGDIVNYIHQYVEPTKVNFPDFDTPSDPFEIDDSQIEGLAAEARAAWDLGNGPISDVVLLAENKGAVVSRFDLHADELDAYSQWDPAAGRPYIILNSGKGSAARSRFDVAHEIGHLLLHRRVPHWALDNGRVFRKVEDQAHLFAGAFLLPASTYQDEFRAATLDAFVSLKVRWRLSVQFLIMRAHALDLIDEGQKTALFRNLTRRGWRKSEPYDDQWEPERPRFLRRCIEALFDQGISSPEALLSVLDLAPSDVETLAALDPGSLTAPRDREVIFRRRPRLAR